MSVALDREVVELLRADPDLLAIADAVVATQPSDAGRRVSWRLLAVAAVLVTAAAIAAFAPWHGHGNGLVDRALAAVGRGPVLHAVIESEVPDESVVRLSTGIERPVDQRLEYWFDDHRRVLRVRTSILGRAMNDEVIPPIRLAAGGASPVDPALTGFLTAYRNALKSGQARETGRGSFDGRRVIWLRLDYRLFGERVGLDERTYRPVVIEPLNADGTPARQVWRISAIDARPYRPRDFTSAQPPRTGTSIRGANFRMIAPRKAAGLLGWQPLWLSTSFRGLPLQYAQLQDQIQVRPASRTTHGLQLAYGRGANRIQLTEARSVEAAYWLLGRGLPEPGTALVLRQVVSGAPLEKTCQAILHTRGVWVSIDGWNQSSTRCVAAARALVRIAS